jgi:hypothetical protein
MTTQNVIVQPNITNVIVQPKLILTVNIGFAGMNRLQQWTTALRPASPLVSSIGYNTDFSGVEIWTPIGWLILSGLVTYATLPSTTNLAIGSRVYNSDIADFQTWNGESWRP